MANVVDHGNKMRDSPVKTRSELLWDCVILKRPDPANKDDDDHTRSPFKRLQPNHITYGRRRLVKETIPQDDDKLPQVEARLTKARRSRRKVRTKQPLPDIFDSSDDEGGANITIIKKPAGKARQRGKERSCLLADQVAEAWRRATDIPEKDYDNLPDIVQVKEDFKRTPPREDPSIRQLLGIFEETTSTRRGSVVTLQIDVRKTRSRRVPIAPVFEPQLLKRTSSPGILDETSVHLPSSGEEMPPAAIRDSLCSIRSEVFQRDVNKQSYLASTPIQGKKGMVGTLLREPLSLVRGKKRVSFSDNMRTSPPLNVLQATSKASTLKTAIAVPLDPAMPPPLASTPNGKTFAPSFSSIANCSHIERLESRNHNHIQTGFISAASMRPPTGQLISANRPVHYDRPVESVQSPPPSSYCTTTTVAISAEKLNLPFFSERNTTAIPHFNVQSPSSASWEEENTVKNLYAGRKTYSKSPASADVTPILSDASGPSFDPDLVEPSSLLRSTHRPSSIRRMVQKEESRHVPSHDQERSLPPQTPDKSASSYKSILPAAPSRPLITSSNLSRSNSQSQPVGYARIQISANQSAVQPSMTSVVSRLNMSRMKSMMQTGHSCRRITLAATHESPPLEGNVVQEHNVVSVLQSFAALTTTRVVLEDDRVIELTSRQKVLALCQPNTITAFKTVLTKDVLSDITKIGEGSYGEIYLTKSPDGVDVVVKIVPFERDVDEETVFTGLLPELMICTTFRKLKDSNINQTPHFIDMMRACCVKGTFPKKLVQEWDAFDELQSSENLNPRHFKKDQLHLIMMLNNGGRDVESYKFTSAEESLGCFLQILFSLAAAEQEFEFEHRDLHWGNVLVATTSEKSFQYYVAGIRYEIPSGSVKVSIIDFSLSRMSYEGYVVHDDLSKHEDIFTGDAAIDYQFEVYRMMRNHNGNNWEKFCPKTNVFWLHYLLDKLLYKKYSSRGKKHLESKKILEAINDSIMDFESAKDFAESSFLHKLIPSLD